MVTKSRRRKGSFTSQKQRENGLFYREGNDDGDEYQTLINAPETILDEDSIVDLSEPLDVSMLDGTKVVGANSSGDSLVDFAPEERRNECIGDTDFDENLADKLDESYLDKIAEKKLEEVKADIDSRKPWEDKYEAGIENLGLISDEQQDEPFEGAATVTYPLLIDGIIQFQARALAEMFPASGAVKEVILGDITDEKKEKAVRKRNYMNYQMITEDESYFDELDQMLFYLPISGSAFKKTFWNPLTETVVSKFVKAGDCIVNYSATSLESAERVTHDLSYSRNEMAILQAKGFYSKVELVKEDTVDTNEITDVKDDIDSRTKVVGDDDYTHQVYEISCFLDLEGFEDCDDSGEETEIALPYLVSIDVKSEKVISIYRNWREKDHLRVKKSAFVHYKYLPGLGFYGFGLWHIIGNICLTVNGALRSILDSAAFSTLQGGFMAKTTGFNKEGVVTLVPGVWTPVDATAEELSKMFYTPPFRESSPTLFNTMQLLINAAAKTSSVTEAMVGEGGANTPVGTELARIEQGTKVYSGIHKRLHKAASLEFKIRSELNFEYLEYDEEYPYDVEGESRYIKGSDFDGEVDIIPVSDPNAGSTALRIAQSQALLQMQQMNPNLYNDYEIHKRALQAQNVPDIDGVLVDPDKIDRLDAISEIQAIMMQKEVRAFPDQNHTEHIAVLVAFMQHPDFGADPTISQLIMPKLVALLAEHKAYEFAQLMSQSGVPVAETDLRAGRGQSILVDEPNIQEEYAITQTASQMIPQFMQQQAAQLSQAPQEPPEDPAITKTKADIARADAISQAEQQRKDADFQAEQNRKNIAAQEELRRIQKKATLEEGLKKAQMGAEIERKDIAANAEEERKDVKADAEIERDDMKHEANEDKKDDEFVGKKLREDIDNERENIDSDSNT